MTICNKEVIKHICLNLYKETLAFTVKHSYIYGGNDGPKQEWKQDFSMYLYIILISELCITYSKVYINKRTYQSDKASSQLWLRSGFRPWSLPSPACLQIPSAHMTNGWGVGREVLSRYVQ